MAPIPALLQDRFRFFKSLSVDEIEKMLQFCTYHEADCGTSLWEEGDENNRAVFILDGKLGIKKRTEFSNRYIIVGTYGPGSVAGEMCLLSQEPRSVAAEALTAVRVLFISSADFERLIETCPALGLKLLRGLFKVTSRRLSKSYERIAAIF